MRYELLAISLVLSTTLVLSALLALAGLQVWRTLRPRIVRWPAQEQARLLFALCVWPVPMAAAVALGVLLPAYIAYEPRQTAESISFVLFIPALVCLSGILLGSKQCILSWQKTRKLIANWQRQSERINPSGIPVWRLQHPLPIIAVAGVFRPQLFIATQLFGQLSEEELAAVLRHEQWHLAMRDNLRRSLFAFCQHFLFFLPGTRELERDWRECVEMAADDYAAGTDQGGALNLASALVRIARLFPPGAAVTMPATFSFGLLADSHLARRVQRLMQLADADVQPNSGWGCRLNLAFGLMKFFFPCLLLVVAFQPAALRTVHDLIESIVQILP